jgi:prophage maintenance system killer protein
MSESEAAGRLTSIPGIVDAEATTPRRFEGVSRLAAKSFKTGFLDMVELKIANAPIALKVKKTYFSDLRRKMAILIPALLNAHFLRASFQFSVKAIHHNHCFANGFPITL